MKMRFGLFYQHQYVKLLWKERISLDFRFTSCSFYALISRLHLIQIFSFIRMSFCLRQHFVCTLR